MRRIHKIVDGITIAKQWRIFIGYRFKKDQRITIILFDGIGVLFYKRKVAVIIEVDVFAGDGVFGKVVWNESDRFALFINAPHTMAFPGEEFDKYLKSGGVWVEFDSAQAGRRCIKPLRYRQEDGQLDQSENVDGAFLIKLTNFSPLSERTN
jgi:hypothetical protein